MIARVVTEIALDREFDYHVPEDLRAAIQAGTHVEIPFGPRKVRGFVVGFKEKSEFGELKDIAGLVGGKPLITPPIMKLARWMADYYAAPLEQALKTVLPGAVRKRGAKFKERLYAVPTEKASDEAETTPLRKRAPKQAAALDLLLSGEQLLLSELARAAGTTTATLRGLEKKGFIRITHEPLARDPLANQHFLRTQPHTLMPEQTQALAQVTQSIDTGSPPVVLLFGVTGSGKTEIYLQGMAHALAQGKGAIVLVPEIALTPQTVERFRGRFGNDIAVLHSHLSEGERHDEWHRVREGKARIVVGARSALFAPVENLGLIVVDEEHEPTYKQEEAPRYNARDVAVMRGRMEKCCVVLGSATPAVESYQNGLAGKYAIAELSLRIDDRRMPVMRVVDMTQQRDAEGRLNMLAGDLVDAIHLRLARQEQTILFLNRRGYSSSLICCACGHVEECTQCSVSMNYHRKLDELRCHLCGESRRVPAACPACKDPRFKYQGIGTEKVESTVNKLFPRAVVRRMDSDTMTRKDSYRKVLGEFRTGQIDILIGTQMIAKGLHFPNVTLVGVINADSALHLPDFRAGERTFQLLTQVAGRAGRGDVSGEVIVQTFTPFHPAIQAAREQDFPRFFDQEVEFRRELFYPPFARLACLTFRGPVEKETALAAEQFGAQLESLLDLEQIRYGGVAEAPIARVKGMYRFQIILRAARTRDITHPVRHVATHFKLPKKVRLSIDVDAMSLL